MTIPTQSVVDLRGNAVTGDGYRISYDSQANTNLLGLANHPGQYAGTGAPTFSAAKGSTYVRVDGSSTSTRMYINTDGGTTWTNFTSAA